MTHELEPQRIIPVSEAELDFPFINRAEVKKLGSIPQPRKENFLKRIGKSDPFELEADYTLTEMVRSMSLLYRRVFEIEKRKPGLLDRQQDLSNSLTSARDVYFEEEQNFATDEYRIGTRRICPIINSVFSTASDSLWGVYIGRKRLVLGVLGTFLAVVVENTNSDFKNNFTSEEEAFFTAFDLFAREPSFYPTPFFSQVVIASAELGKIYGIPPEKWLPKKRGYFTHFMDVAERYVEESKIRLEKYSSIPKERIRYLQEVLVVRGEEQEENISYWDIYRQLSGLNSEQRQLTAVSLKDKFRLLQPFNISHLYSIWHFSQEVLDGRNKVINIGSDGKVVYRDEYSNRRFLPDEVRIDLKRRAGKDALLRISEIERSDWRQHYHSLEVLAFDKFLLQTFIEELESQPVVRDTNVEYIYEVVRNKCLLYLAQNYPEGNFNFSKTILINRIFFLSYMEKNWQRSGMGLQEEDSLTAVNLIRAKKDQNFNKLALRIPPSKYIYNYWSLHPSQKWKEMATELNLSESSFSYAAKSALVHTILSEDGREDLLAMEKQYPFRRRDFFDWLREWNGLGKSPEQLFSEAIDTALILKGANRFNKNVAKVAVKFCSETDKDFPLENYVLEKVAKGCSAREICRLIGFPNLKEIDPRFLIISEMIKLSVRYPLKWSFYTQPLG